MVFFPSACELRPMVSETLELLQQRALEKGLTFKLDIAKDVPQQVWVDGPRLCQVLRHLVDNAVKFTHTGSVSVRVTVESADLERATLRFEITDTGIGMTPEQAETVFETYRQAEKGTPRRFGGTGLGLAIAKHLVEAMGGRIAVRTAREFGGNLFHAAGKIEGGAVDQGVEQVGTAREFIGQRGRVGEDAHDHGE